MEIKVSLVASVATAKADKIFTECAKFSIIQRLWRLDSYWDVPLLPVRMSTVPYLELVVVQEWGRALSSEHACSYPSDRCLSPPLRMWENLCKEIGDERQRPLEALGMPSALRMASSSRRESASDEWRVQRRQWTLKVNFSHVRCCFARAHRFRAGFVGLARLFCAYILSTCKPKYVI